ncbi:hypothetical protein [Algoriphagus namhaensis]
MKRCLFVISLVTFLYSCTASEEPISVEEIWSFTGYSCSFCSNPNEFFPVSDSTYYYTFRPDSSFTKNIGTFELSGRYEVETTPDDQTYLVLQYNQASVDLDRNNKVWPGLIHYCGQEYEPLLIQDDGKLIGSWGACDGPRLVFEKDQKVRDSIFF